MVLFDHVVQILDLTNLDGRLAPGINRVKRCQIKIEKLIILAFDFINSTWLSE
jgi:hypothetical protein